MIALVFRCIYTYLGTRHHLRAGRNFEYSIAMEGTINVMRCEYVHTYPYIYKEDFYTHCQICIKALVINCLTVVTCKLIGFHCSGLFRIAMGLGIKVQAEYECVLCRATRPSLETAQYVVRLYPTIGTVDAQNLISRAIPFGGVPWESQSLDCLPWYFALWRHALEGSLLPHSIRSFA